MMARGEVDLAVPEIEIEDLKESDDNLRRQLREKSAELAKATQRLRSLEERYFLSFSHVQDIVYMIDSDLKLASVSPSVEKILGYRPQELIGRPLNAPGHILSPESFAQATSDAVEMLGNKNIPMRVYKFIARDGTARYVEVSGSYILQQGQAAGIIAVARDITQRLAVEKQTRNMLTFLKTLIDTIPSPIFYKDLHGVTGTAIGNSRHMWAGKERKSSGRAPMISSPVSWPRDIPPRTGSCWYGRADRFTNTRSGMPTELSGR